ncbi:Nitric oxide synthase, inducible [Gonapodya sp. JEL0774]|nr:Nitric oxide synthase, inducible [Gonapodya sp. JEL0774]
MLLGIVMKRRLRGHRVLPRRRVLFGISAGHDASGCSKDVCAAALMDQGALYGEDDGDRETVLKEAKQFLDIYYAETEAIAKDVSLEERKAQVHAEVEATGTYHQTFQELEYGVKLAWRNSSRCIFRIQWKNINVIDARRCETAEGMIKACHRHLDEATNGGNIKSTITIFPQRKAGMRGPRIWNPQLLRYAGYSMADAAKYGLTVAQKGLESARHLIRPEGDAFSDFIGDPAHVEFTRVCLEMGWRPSNNIASWFDVLPIVAEDGQRNVVWADVPPSSVLEVPIRHPDYPALESFDIKWHAVPAISSMALTIGGIVYSACPFNGWYMSAEIGSRNLCDIQRYNLLPLMGQIMDVDSRSQSNKRSLWKDRAFVEVNAAVLSSFDSHGVSIVDHHTASDSFITFANREIGSRGYFTGDWIWLTPPISGSATSVFHQEMVKMTLKPAFMGFREASWKTGNPSAARAFRGARRAVTAPDRFVTKSDVNENGLLLGQSLAGPYLTPSGISDNRTLALPAISSSSARFSFFGSLADPSVSRSRQSTLASRYSDHDLASRNSDRRPITMDISLLENASILVGTETGNAETLATRFAAILKKYGVHITPVLIENVPESFVAHCSQKRMVFIFVSTFGDGELPTEAAGCLSELKASATGALNHLSFAVFGLCSSAYPKTFNGAANELSARLTALGATRLGPIGVGDELEDREGAFQQWQQTVFGALGVTHDRLNDSMTSIKLSVLPPQKQTQQWADARITKSNPLFVDGNRGTWHVELVANGLDYRAGDHLAIMPSNPDDLVNEAALLLRIQDAASVEILRTTVDLGGVCPRDLLISLREVAESYGVKVAMDATPISNTTVTTINVLRKFFSRVESNCNERPLFDEVMLSGLPTLQPRYYSIASSAKGLIALTVSRDMFNREDGTLAFGLCSDYITRQPISSLLRVMVRRSARFYLPTAFSGPIALVANGTGIAPFRAFIHEIASQRHEAHGDGKSVTAETPQVTLYFGCRSVDELLYHSMIKRALRERVISRCVVALSRQDAPEADPVPNVETIIYHGHSRIQDVIRADSEGIKGVLASGLIYVCGSRTMGAGVAEACDHVASTTLGVQGWTKLAKRRGAFLEDTY